jgi:hypothetical protein
MKPKILLSCIFAIFFSACSQTTFYQLYKTESKNVQKNSEGMVFENDEVKVIFNFWDESGSSSFLLFNKTESDIFIDLRKSHLILNSIAHTYFQNRTFSETTSSSISLGGTSTSSYYKGTFATTNALTNSIASLSTISSKSKSTVAKGSSVTNIEQDVICIPPKAAKAVSGFSLHNTVFRDCDLLRYPTKNKIASKRFTTNTTPLDIKNIISYGFDEALTGSFKKIEIGFWVSEIANYPYSEFTKTIYPEYCGKKSKYHQTHFVHDGPERFYIKYYKNTIEEFEF